MKGSCSSPSFTAVSLPAQSVDVDADSSEGEVEDAEDVNVCTASEGSVQVLRYEYHIMYSCSYSTPVLYFRASTLG